MGIYGFFGENRWLSNFWIAPMEIDGKIYQSVEHYYQSQKALHLEDRERIRLAPTPAEAKRLGKAVELNTHLFPSLRVMVMNTGIRAKFDQHPDLKAKLIATSCQHLEETNTWGDTYWGKCNGEGYNKLGWMLVDLRVEYEMDILWSHFS